MTQVIIDDIIPRTQLVSAAGQTVFNTNWTANVTTDVLVYARAAGIPANDATQLVSSSDYTVTLVGGSQTVRVTFTSGRTLDDVITIVRDTPAERMNLYINTNFVPSMLNEDFGILTLVDQQSQMYDYVVNPGYNVSATIENIVDTVLPILAANQVWAMNPTRTAIIAYDVPEGGGMAPSDATYLIQVANGELPNAQAMGALASGLVVNTTTTGVQLTRVLTGVANQTVVTNGDGISGNPTLGIASNPTIPGMEYMIPPTGTTAQRPGSPVESMMRYNTSVNSLEFYNGTQWTQPFTVVFPLTVAQGGTGDDSFTPYAPIIGGTTSTGALQSAGAFQSVENVAFVSHGSSAPPGFSSDVYIAQILDANANTIMAFSTTPTAVNYVSIINQVTGSGPNINAAGSDPTVALNFAAKGAAPINFGSEALTNQYTYFSGTGYAHTSIMNFPATSASRTYTWPDVSGTVSVPQTGTFTPVFTSSGGGTATYSTQTGTYTLIADRCYFDIVIVLSGLPSAGNVTITGLPFTCTESAVPVAFCQNLQAGVTIPPLCNVPASANVLTLWTWATGSPSPLTVALCGSSSVFVITGWYKIT